MKDLSDSVLALQEEFSGQIKALQVSVDQRITEDLLLRDKIITVNNSINKLENDILDMRIDVDGLKTDVVDILNNTS